MMQQKKNIAKLHLNTLYGMFGRKLDTLTSIAATPSEQYEIVSKYPVKNWIEINKNLKLFLVHTNIDFDLIHSSNEVLGIDLLMQSSQKVNSNVAIAAAITAYARIVLMKYKNIDGLDIYYSDTDSIFTNKELPASMVGDGIGLMKDELAGGFVQEAYFFGVKKYAYIDQQGSIKTIFSGVPRNSLTWEEVLRLANHETVRKMLPIQFHKTIERLEISFKLNKYVNVKWLSNKKLVDNKYQHIHINEMDNSYLDTIKNIFIGKIRKFITMFKKKLIGVYKIYIKDLPVY